MLDAAVWALVDAAKLALIQSGERSPSDLQAAALAMMHISGMFPSGALAVALHEAASRGQRADA